MESADSPGFSKLDKQVIFGLIGAWLLFAVGAHIVSIYEMHGMILEVVLNLSIMAAGGSAAYFMYKNSSMFGGMVGRGLTLISIGIGYAGLMAVLHVYMHLNQPQLLWFFTGHHTALAWAALVLSYGLYLLYKGGKK